MKTVKTGDGSYTLFSDVSGEHYHSLNGALTESEHIFVNLGFKFHQKTDLNILEVGYGSGLNALLTYKNATEIKKRVFYHGVDILAIDLQTANMLDYRNVAVVSELEFSGFYSSWNHAVKISDNFILYKQLVSLHEIESNTNYDIVYFDAFSPEIQPEMWSEEIFRKISSLMCVGAILLTYCSKGIVKQNLRNTGFDVKRLTGPPGKRHVLRATKL